MFAQTIRLECISFFVPGEGVWRDGDVKAMTEEKPAHSPNDDEEDFEAFCRRSLT